MSVRHCAATTAPRNGCPNCYAEQNHKDSARRWYRTEAKEVSPLSLAQHHLPPLDLFWASFLRVQLTSFLLISPGLCISGAGTRTILLYVHRSEVAY